VDEDLLEELGNRRQDSARSLPSGSGLGCMEGDAGWRRMNGGQELPAVETKVIPPDLGSGDAREGI
jgi:hypothetical protein